MPELPEVETMRRGLAGIVGRRIATVEFPRSRVRPLSVATTSVTRRGAPGGSAMVCAVSEGMTSASRVMEARVGSPSEAVSVVVSAPSGSSTM